MNLTPQQLRDRADAIESQEAGRPVEFYNETREQWRPTTSPSSMWLYNVHIRPAPAPEPPKPWDCAADLAELGPVIWLRNKSGDYPCTEALVICISDISVTTQSGSLAHIRWSDFDKWTNAEYSTDRRNWKPCHKLP